jgi:hypothetical protein
MRTEFISRDTLVDRVKETARGNRVCRMAVVARSWADGREALKYLAKNLNPHAVVSDTELEYDRANVKALPGPGCFEGDFLTRDIYDEVYIIPDGLGNQAVYKLSKLLLGMK